MQEIRECLHYDLKKIETSSILFLIIFLYYFYIIHIFYKNEHNTANHSEKL